MCVESVGLIKLCCLCVSDTPAVTLPTLSQRRARVSASRTGRSASMPTLVPVRLDARGGSDSERGRERDELDCIAL